MRKINKNLFVVFAGIFLGLALASCQNPFLQLEKDAVSVPGQSSFVYSPSEDSEGPAFTVSFVTNGGSPVTSISNVAPGSLISEPETSMDYFIVEGWYKDLGLDDPWDFSYDEVNSNLTLYAGWDFDEGAQGDGLSEDTPFLVYDALTLKKVGSEPTGAEAWDTYKYYLQIKDIDMTGINWIPIGPASNKFAGSYNGGGKTISNLKYAGDPMGGDYVGLFSSLGDGARLENIRLVNANIQGRDYVGGIVGDAGFSAVTNCYVTGSIKGRDNVGGIAGLVDFMTSSCYGSVETCFADCTIESMSNKVGGLAGNNKGKIINCHAAGMVKTYGGTMYAGGLVGMNEVYGVIQNCYAANRVYGDIYVGGITGWAVGSTVENCVALNEAIVGTYYVGRVIGELDGSSTVNNNYAGDEIALSRLDTPDPMNDGITIPAGMENSMSWWTGNAGWVFDDVWEWDAVKQLPVLRGM